MFTVQLYQVLIITLILGAYTEGRVISVELNIYLCFHNRQHFLQSQPEVMILNTLVVAYINTMKTTFDYNFGLY